MVMSIVKFLKSGDAKPTMTEDVNAGTIQEVARPTSVQTVVDAIITEKIEAIAIQGNKLSPLRCTLEAFQER
jgi:hypothetical protein